MKNLTNFINNGKEDSLSLLINAQETKKHIADVLFCLDGFFESGVDDTTLNDFNITLEQAGDLNSLLFDAFYKIRKISSTGEDEYKSFLVKDIIRNIISLDQNQCEKLSCFDTKENVLSILDKSNLSKENMMLLLDVIINRIKKILNITNQDSPYLQQRRKEIDVDAMKMDDINSELDLLHYLLDKKNIILGKNDF